MIGIWYFDPVTAKWLLFADVPQASCEEHLASIRASGLTSTVFQISRRRPRAIPHAHVAAKAA